jgi:hypothetical protein
MARIVCCLLSALSIAPPLLAPCSFADEAKEARPTFKQYVGVYTRSSPKHQVILQQLKVRRLGDRDFLVGTPVEYETGFTEEPKSRLTASKAVVKWIALAEVIGMYEFDDIRGYRLDGE